MNRDELLAFLRRHKLAVQATVSPSGMPQAAVVGIGVSDDLEIVFDTLGASRKGQNLRRDPKMALVVGWDEAQTAQIEGLADEPTGADLERLQRVYFAAYPDGPSRLSWPGITYVRLRPQWIRFSDFRGAEAQITELAGSALAPRL